MPNIVQILQWNLIFIILSQALAFKNASSNDIYTRR